MQGELSMDNSPETLWKQYIETGSKGAKEKLIVSYIDLVKIIAGRLYTTYNSNVEFDDLVSYGIIGLIDAIEKFDQSKNVKFETYANIRIRGGIVDQLRALDWIPRSKRQKFKTLEEAISRLQHEHGYRLADELIAREIGIALEEFNELMAEMSTISVMSLDEKISDNVNFSVSTDAVSDSPEKSFDEKEMKEILGEAIDGLGEKEKLVITLYYYEELTYKEISKILGISESRISQIHSKSILTIKGKLKNIFE
jgi:RNA polymerase sigma factor FliA